MPRNLTRDEFRRDFIELTSPYHYTLQQQGKARRTSTPTIPGNIPLKEWRKSIACAPQESIIKTLASTTQYYTSVEVGNRDDPRKHYKSRFPGLRVNRLNETVSTDTDIASDTSDRGNKFAQMFIGCK